MLSVDVNDVLNLPSLLSDGGILSSPNEALWSPVEPEGSFYRTLAVRVEEMIADSGDWNWLSDGVTGDVMSAKEAIECGQK